MTEHVVCAPPSSESRESESNSSRLELIGWLCGAQSIVGLQCVRRSSGQTTSWNRQSRSDCPRQPGSRTCPCPTSQRRSGRSQRCCCGSRRSRPGVVSRVEDRVNARRRRARVETSSWAWKRSITTHRVLVAVAVALGRAGIVARGVRVACNSHAHRDERGRRALRVGSARGVRALVLRHRGGWDGAMRCTEGRVRNAVRGRCGS